MERPGGEVQKGRIWRIIQRLKLSYRTLSQPEVRDCQGTIVLSRSAGVLIADHFGKLGRERLEAFNAHALKFPPQKREPSQSEVVT